MINSTSAKYQRARKESYPLFALGNRIRCLVYVSLKDRGYRKKSRTAEILGCRLDFFKTHIEKQFLLGMSWANRADWHIDHITPLATAATEAEVLALNHFTNLRPMWGKDNLSKRAKITNLL